jgi:nitroimidazol reductase NimA-like FMN-containing flavoprotein (pyridoxamine 5'-phosphate oxidase superfamily)
MGKQMNTIDEPLFDPEFNKAETKDKQNSDLAGHIRRLVNEQAFCVLCTQGQKQPYGSLIACAFTEDLKHFFFKTQIATRKYKLLKECQHVSLVIDSRCQHQEDMTEVEAVTITGKAERLQKGADYELGIRLLRSRHAYLSTFLDSASTALFRINVVRYFHVTRFQEVSQWIP